MVDQSKTDGDNQGWSDGSTPSEAVIETIAEETASDPLKLPPLNNAIDLEALDSLFVNRQGDRHVLLLRTRNHRQTGRDGCYP